MALHKIKFPIEDWDGIKVMVKTEKANGDLLYQARMAVGVPYDQLQLVDLVQVVIPGIKTVIVAPKELILASNIQNTYQGERRAYLEAHKWFVTKGNKPTDKNPWYFNKKLQKRRNSYV